MAYQIFATSPTLYNHKMQGQILWSGFCLKIAYSTLNYVHLVQTLSAYGDLSAMAGFQPILARDLNILIMV